ncbi:hypothetical protein PFWH6_2009 [Pseudomonas fluorescens WH6]|nr:hypothetical protein PFWH6_2009 [Pseudomonas fluorescens WH6]
MQVPPLRTAPVTQAQPAWPAHPEGRRVRRIPRLPRCWSASMRGNQTAARTGRCRDAASRFFGETTALDECALPCQACAGYRNRPTTVTRTSTH